MNKLQKKTSKAQVYIISFNDILPGGVTIDSIDAITIEPTGLHYGSEEITTTIIDGVPVGRGISIQFYDGDDGVEYCITVSITDSDLIEREIIATLVTSNSKVVNDTDYYGFVWGGDDYCQNRLNSDAWTDSTNPDKRKALTEATRLIDRLNFKGQKTSDDQTLQFPRGGDADVPNDILIATYEIAIKLLEEVDPDLEVDDLRTTAQGYSSVRVSKDTSWTLEHIQAGIPSYRAWTFLKPYLRDPKAISISRVN